MNRLLLPLILAMLAASTQKTLSADQSQDEAEIRNLVQTRQQEAWNRHDAKAYAALFTEDGDLVNVVGGGKGVLRSSRSLPMLTSSFFAKAV
jgi:uncharacterized protein (TIGR02246 family)